MKGFKPYKKLQRKKNPFAASFHFLNIFRALHKEQNCGYFKYGCVKYGVSKWQQFVYNFVEVLTQKLFQIFQSDSAFQLGLGNGLKI